MSLETHRAQTPRLGLVGAVSGFFALAGLATVAALVVLLLLASSDALGRLPQPTNGRTLADLRGHFDDVQQLALVAGLAAVGTGVFFLAWLLQAGRVTGALQPNPHRRSVEQGFRSGEAVPTILIANYGILRMLYSLVQIPSSDRRSGVFATVNKVAERSRLPGRRDVGPIKILVWWIFWLPPLLICAGVWLAIPILRPDDIDVARAGLQFTMFLLGLELLSLACITATVWQVTSRLVTAPRW